MNIKAKLNTERTHDDGNFVRVYDVGSYLVIVQSWRKNSKCIFVDIRSDSDSKRYLPHLSAHDNMEGGFRDAGVSVQTTSYGSLSPVEIKQFMRDMQEGIDTAEYIGEHFIRPMMDGTWEWEVK